MNKPLLIHQSGCSQCKTAEMILQKANIEFDESSDTQILVDKGIFKTPTLIVGDECIVGAKSIKDWIESQK